MKPGRHTALSIAVAGGEPPSEFCLFRFGANETTKGTFVFDEAAAISVMAEYAKHGIDLMIDYDHASLAAVSLDPATAGKAAGWFNLAVRNGELWAVNVRWTEPAAAALRAKEWRFMSPAFNTQDGKVTDLLNVAITNLPATRKLTPLMAASITALGDSMLDAEHVTAALDALIAGDAEKCAELLNGIIAAAAGGDPDAAAEAEEPAAVDAAAEPQAAAEVPVPSSDDPEKDKPAAVAASKLLRLTGRASLAAAVSDVETWRASHLELEGERQKLAAERATLESAERRKLCVELVTLGGRSPATVWADDSAKAPKAYLAAMPIEDLRAMHADALKASGKGAPKPPVQASAASASKPGSFGLDARELKICVETGCDPKTFAMLKARRTTTA